MTSDMDLCLIGAGPQALAVALHARAAAPDLRIRAIDPAGRWLATWVRTFAALEIPHLRSPGVHHPHPRASAWGEFRRNRALSAIGRYDLPTTAGFAQFCTECIDRADLHHAVEPGFVERVVRRGTRLAVEMAGGHVVVADHVVSATNPRRPRVDPVFTGVVDRNDAVRHSSSIDLRSCDVAGRTVLVVGGGLTAFHLVSGALARGARVVLVARRPLRARPFDVDPGWLGPKYLDGYARISEPAERLRRALDARDGGSMTPEALARLRSLARWGQVTVLECRMVTRLSTRADGYEVGVTDTDSRTLTFRVDQIWLATGSEPTVDADPVLAAMREEHRPPTVHGLPCLDRDLRWPGTPLHIVGALATLELGPAAGNLWGARQAAARVTRAVVGEERWFAHEHRWSGLVWTPRNTNRRSHSRREATPSPA